MNVCHSGEPTGIISFLALWHPLSLGERLPERLLLGSKPTRRIRFIGGRLPERDFMTIDGVAFKVDDDDDDGIASQEWLLITRIRDALHPHNFQLTSPQV